LAAKASAGTAIATHKATSTGPLNLVAFNLRSPSSLCTTRSTLDAFDRDGAGLAAPQKDAQTAAC
jgi:hypothetical protein